VSPRAHGLDTAHHLYYQWQLCNALGGSCANISGATGPSLQLALGDVGGLLDVVVKATNVAGSTSSRAAHRPDRALTDLRVPCGRAECELAPPPSAGCHRTAGAPKMNPMGITVEELGPPDVAAWVRASRRTSPAR